MLDPDGNLKHTSENLSPLLATLGCKHGVTGKQDAEAINSGFRTGLSQHDIFIYCGHNAGEQYIAREQICKLPTCGVAMLMGCSSASLECNGDYDPEGAALSYIISDR
jgi:separase